MVLGLAFIVPLTVDAGAVAQSTLRLHSWGLVFPILGARRLAGRARRRAGTRRDGVPFVMAVAFFFAAFLDARRDDLALHDPVRADRRRCRRAGRLAALLLLWPEMIHMPVIAAYTGSGVYWVFRGKIDRFGG